MAKYIFVTGGVVSGLGKGITTASIGILLKSCGFSVDAVKFDPYLNIDPGTMSPYEHGEVYVLEDGSETDLDLGHYERFLDTNLNRNSSVTAGKIYDSILNKERTGDYLGKNVQLIPHVTNFLQEAFAKEIPKKANHIRLVEIGGSTGDLEGEIFLESFRQFRSKMDGKVMHIHLGFVPYLDCSGEYKTKPLQTSVRELLRSGLQPDVIVARFAPKNKEVLSREILEKIALFSNLEPKNVVSLPDLSSIYQVPPYLKSSNLKPILEKFTKSKLDLDLPLFFSKSSQNGFKKQVTIAIVAKYPKLTDAYLSVIESLKIAGTDQDTNINTIFVDAEVLTLKNPPGDKKSKEFEKIKNADGIIIPGGFGIRGLEGKIEALKFARENQIPFLGICLGLQMAVVEFARNVLKINAYSSEMLESENPGKSSKKTREFVIDYIPEQKNIHKKGGTMRLGAYECKLENGTLAKKLFNKNKIVERHRHRLEVQNKYLKKLSDKGLVVSGKHFYKDKNQNEKFLVEIIELSQKIHPFFIATQSHPEFLSRPDKPHPLFKGLVEAASKRTHSK